MSDTTHSASLPLLRLALIFFLNGDMEGLPMPLDVCSAEVFSKGQQEFSDERDFRMQAALFVDFC